jgi:type II secretory pathway pseudopilin PulG
MQYVALTLKQRGERMWFPKGKCSGKEVNELRKVMLLAAMLAMVLAAAAPAFAQQTAEAVAGDVTQTQYNAVCQNVFDEITAQGAQYGNIGDLEAERGDLAQSIAQEQNVSVEVVNECLNAFGATVTATATATASATATAAAGGGGGGGATATASLPPTGGPVVPSSALALGAGALLVAGGLLARRLVR